MSEMAREFFSDNPAMAGPLFAMLLFTTVFVVALVRVLVTRRDEIERLAHLPFEGEDALPSESEVNHG